MSPVDSVWYYQDPRTRNKCIVCPREPVAGGRFPACPGCNCFFYCSPNCMKIHREEHDHFGIVCATHTLLQKDYRALSLRLDRHDDVSWDTFVEYVGRTAEGQRLRTQANQLVRKKQWEVALQLYGQATDIFHSAIQTADSNDEHKLLLWMGANLGRVYSNIVLCMLEGLRRDSCDYSKESMAQLESIPLHDAGSIIMVARQSGIDQAREQARDFYKIPKDAVRMCRDYSGKWWKTYYREAQVHLLHFDPIAAMHSVQLAYQKANDDEDMFYDKRKESEAANNAIRLLEEEVNKVMMALEPEYAARETPPEGAIVVKSVQYLVESGYNELGSDHSRAPRSEMGPEMLAVRLFAAIEGEPNGTKEDQEEACQILNLILSCVSKAPLFLFPPDGSTDDRTPPITVSLIAFYLRAALSPDQLKKINVEERLKQATRWMSDTQAYCIATHNYEEFESNHSPLKGHAKKFVQSGSGNCMPCSFRMLRSGTVSDWADGLRMAAHEGKIEVLCFFLNRLLGGIDGQNALAAILEPDRFGCNAMMHAVNDNATGFSGLTIRLLAHAASFHPTLSEVDKENDEAGARMRNIREVINSTDGHGYTPSLAAVHLVNEPALVALVSLRAKLYTKSLRKKKGKPRAITLEMMEKGTQDTLLNPETSPRFKNLIRSIQASTNNHPSCSYCGRPPVSKQQSLGTCARCQLARYCDAKCQKADYKRHKFICTAKVSRDVNWYSNNIHLPFK